MEVTNVNLKKYNTTMRAKAIASVVLKDGEDAICINEIRVIEGKDGLFIAMPSKRMPDGNFKDMAHPINQRTRDKIQKAILEKYNEI